MSKIKSLVIFCFIIIYSCVSLSFGHNPFYQRDLKECPMRKMEIDYKSKGRDFKLGNLSIYETKDTKPQRLLIAAYDIFGDSANTRLFCDVLAEVYGFTVVLPDFFRGRPYDWTVWPPVPQKIQEWSKTVADWDTIVKPDVEAILKYYRTEHNIFEAGIFGFCWGGKVSTLAASQIPEIKAAGFVHPSDVTNDMARDVETPMYIMPCKDDPELITFYRVNKQKFGDKSGYKRYTDMCHGFATAMGNFSDPNVSRRVFETIHRLGNFFNRNMPIY